MNNASIENIKKALDNVKHLFDPSKSSYQILNNCTRENMTASDMLIELNKIGDTKDYPEELRKFFYNRYQELEALAKLDQEIKIREETISKLNQELSIEFQKRHEEYSVKIDFNKNYFSMNYNEKKEYLAKLNNDIETLKNQKRSLNKEKTSGKEYDQELTSKDIEYNKEELNNIQEKANKNKITYVNPLINNVKNYYNYYQTNQKENSNLNVAIEYIDNNNIKLNIGYKGTEINENEPLIECIFSDPNYFEAEIYPYLVHEHVVEGGIKGYNIKENKLKSENINDEHLEVKADPEKLNQTAFYLDQEIVREDQVKENEINKPKVRKLVNENERIGIANVLIITLFIIFALIIFLLLMII